MLLFWGAITAEHQAGLMDWWLCTLPILTSPTKSLNIMSHLMVAFFLLLSSFTSHCSVTGAIACAILPTPAHLRFAVDSVWRSTTLDNAVTCESMPPPIR